MRILFEKLHSFRVLRIAFAVLFLCVLGFGLIMGDALEGKTGFAGMQTTFSKAKLQTILDEWGKYGLIAYMNSMYIDFIFPVAYAVALASSVALVSTEKEKAATPTKMALVFFTLPLVAGVCDIIENSFHLIMLPNLSAFGGGLVFLSALASTIKFVLMFITILAIAYYAYQRLQARREVK
ncbi:MAG: hypothetical protein V2J07_08855 [Anaerolineae bacterium]|jgi:hypothetical protein|nr:hypothetical protein [Anaerolineae bacterium]